MQSPSFVKNGIRVNPFAVSRHREVHPLSSSPIGRAIPLLLFALLATGLAACDTTTTRPAPPPLNNAGPAVAVSAGSGWQTCSVRVDGRIVCWGLDSSGSPAQEPPADADFQAVSVGEGHACAIRNNGDLVCWNSVSNRLDLRDGPFVSVSSARFHACALREDGVVECWIAEGNSALRSDVGQAAPPEGRFQAVAAGEWHTCGIRTDSSLTCWGANNDARSYILWNYDKFYGQATPPAGNRWKEWDISPESGRLVC